MAADGSALPGTGRANRTPSDEFWRAVGGCIRPPEFRPTLAAPARKSHPRTQVRFVLSISERLDKKPGAHLGEAYQPLEVSMKGLNAVTMLLLIIGGINWAIVGIAGLNIVATIFAFSPIVITIVYNLVGLSAIYQLLPLTRQLQEGIA